MSLTLPLSADEALSILNHYKTNPLPPADHVFPWLRSSSNNNYRALKSWCSFIRSCQLSSPNSNITVLGKSALLKDSIDFSALLTPLSALTSHYSSINHDHNSNLNMTYLTDYVTKLLTFNEVINDKNDPLIQVVIDDILEINYLPDFINTNNEWISIRSFDWQTYKIGIMSDLIVYCFNNNNGNNCDTCQSVARLLSIAQINFQKLNPDIFQKIDDDIQDDNLTIESNNHIDHFDSYDDIEPIEDGNEEEIDFGSVLEVLKQKTQFKDEEINKSPLTSMIESFRKVENIINSINNKFYKTYIVTNPVDILKSLNSDGNLKYLIAIPPFDQLTCKQIKNIDSIYSENSIVDDDDDDGGGNNNHNNTITTFTDFELFNLENNYLDFGIKEKSEIWKISKAQEILNGIWLGNESDFCMWKTIILKNVNKNNNDTINHEIIDYTNKPAPYCDLKNSIFYNNPNCFLNSEIFEKIQNILLPSTNKDYLIPNLINWKLFIDINSSTNLPTLEELKEIYGIVKQNKNTEPIKITFPPSGSIAGIGSLSIINIYTIINLCKILYNKDSDNWPCLIFCPEGYTETSLFAVIYLMYSTGVYYSKDAILQLYLKYGRPFYLFENDYLLLERLEPIIYCYSPVNKYKIEKLLFIKQKILSILPQNQLLEINELSNSLLNQIFMTFDDQILSTHSWFKDINEPITGSILPSRILSNLYLGSLEHGNNLSLLNTLNIRTLICVGECPNWIKDHNIMSIKEDIKGLHILTFHKNLKVDHVLLVDGIKDDGIDSLSTKILNEIFKFFENYTDISLETILGKSSNINSTLVHCKVGVSRSATVVIGYLMKFLKMKLENAYLFVRVRRLNIIIQPNLKLCYELFKFQEELILQDKKSFLFKKKSNHEIVYSIKIPSRKKSNVSETSSIISNRPRDLSTSSSLQTDISIETDDLMYEEEDDDDEVDDDDDKTILRVKLDDKENNWLRNIDWFKFCEEIHNLNKF